MELFFQKELAINYFCKRKSSILESWQNSEYVSVNEVKFKIFELPFAFFLTVKCFTDFGLFLPKSFSLINLFYAWDGNFSLNPLLPNFFFWSPWNIRKTFGFLFSGGSKANIGKKRVFKSLSTFLLHITLNNTLNLLFLVKMKNKYK